MPPLSPHDTFTRRHLPHIDRPGTPTFITFRLAGSLPNDVMESLTEYAHKWAKEYSDSPKARANVSKRVLAYVDKYLNQAIRENKGPTFLEDPAIASIVEEHLAWGMENRRYLLHAWSVMPNHVHAVIETLPRKYSFSTYCESWSAALQRDTEIKAAEFRNSLPPHEYWPLSQIMRGLKGVSAREINKHLQRTGPVWQDESFDHILKSEPEYFRALNYIANNPVQAGLTQTPNQHPHTKIFANPPPPKP